MSGLRIAVLVLAFVASPASTLAWSPIDSSSPVWCTQVPFAVESDGSDEIAFSTLETEIRRAMEDWTEVSCTGLTSSYTGATSANAGNIGDGVSAIGFIESGWTQGTSTLGVTAPLWTSSGSGEGCIEEASMVLNGDDYHWTTGSGSGDRPNLYSIVLHEGGHYYGLGHSSDSDATMYFAYSGGIDSITSDDANGICSLYPGGSGPVTCVDIGCPSGTMCNSSSGRCERIMGDGTVCSPCTSDDECGGDNDYCLGYPDGNAYCGRWCRTDSDCDGGVCLSTSGGGAQCGRVDSSGFPSCTATMTGCTTDSGCDADERCNTTTHACEPRPTTGAGLGAACTEHSQCNSGICMATPAGSVCTQTCDWLAAATSCPSGFFCDGTASGSCGVGYCRTGGAGAGTAGTACHEHTECASLFCAEGLCSSPCVPDGSVACSAGLVCQAGAVSGCGSCQSVGTTGQPCDGNLDCATRLCAEQDDRSFCTEYCTDATSCPSGFTCENAGSTSVCVPPEGGLIGDTCAKPEDCISNLCTTDLQCTQYCGSAEAGTCPAGYACVSASGAVMVCAPTDDGGGDDGGDGGGCAVTPTRGGSLAVLLTALLALAQRRRRGQTRR